MWAMAAKEEGDAEPHLARLTLLPTAQHRNHSGEEKDARQSRLERADAGYQTVVAQIGEDCPHRDREQYCRGGAQGAAAGTVLPPTAECKKEDCCGQGLRDDPRKTDKSIGQIL